MSHLNINGIDKPLDHIYVKARTENLWDGAIGLDNTIIDKTDGTTIENQNYALSDYIPVSELTSYVYSFRHNQYEPDRTSYTVSCYKSNKQLVQDIVLRNINIEGTISIPFTTPVGTAYIRINWKKPYDDMLMLNTGSTALPYQPYLITKEAWEAKSRVILHGLTNPLCGIDTHKDALDLSTGGLTRYVKELVLTGQEDWYLWNLQSETLQRFYFNLPSSQATISPNSAICTHFIPIAENSREGFRFSTDGGLLKQPLFIVLKSRLAADDVASWKSYLAQQYAAGTPVKVWYALATPETEQITVPSNLAGIVEGYLTQTGNPTPSNPIYPTANGTLEQGGTYSLDTGAYAIAWGRADTFIGTNSISARCYGLPVKSWEIDGNSQQLGTPAPDNIIMPDFVGERTRNLFDVSTIEKGRIDNGEVGYASYTSSLTIEGGTVSFTTTATYRGVCSGFFEIPEGTETLTFNFIRNEALGAKFVFYDNTKTWLNQDYSPSTWVIPPATANVPSGAKYVRLSFTGQITGGYSYTMSNLMLNTGSTSKPYEPYGYFIQTYSSIQNTVSGQTPLTLTDSVGHNLISWDGEGATTSSGTPAPTSPVTVSGWGDKTGNLFDKSTAILGERVLANSVSSSENSAHSDYIDVTGISVLTVNKKYSATNFYFYSDKTNTSIEYVNDFTANVPAGAKYCRINITRAVSYTHLTLPTICSV